MRLCQACIRSHEQGLAFRRMSSSGPLFFESGMLCFSELKSHTELFPRLEKTGPSNALKCGIAWKEVKILVQLDLERSFFNDPFKQLPARLQTIVWPVTPAGGHSRPGKTKGRATS